MIFSIKINLGAHSHIRGLGLDDALDARQVQYNNIDRALINFKYQNFYWDSVYAQLR